jgi:hypothetical protein
MSWRKKLFDYLRQSRPAAGSSTSPRAPDLSNVYESTETQSRQRAEAAIPGTAAIPPILTLVPPPIDPERLARLTGQRTYWGPDPVAAFDLTFPARRDFGTGQLHAAITSELWRYFANPTLHALTPEGRGMYLLTAERPVRATGIVAGWQLRDGDLETIYAGAQGLAAWLARRPEGFAAIQPDRNVLAARCATAQRIAAIGPNDVGFYASARTPDRLLDGKEVWRTLHALGLQWGDMDQFQWEDPTHQTDYLFWAEADDGQIGYALPEEIAAGRQHFRSVLFTFNIARTPQPAHVLEQMERAAVAFATHLDCDLKHFIDRDSVEDTSALGAAVQQVVQALAACGQKPGSDSVCMLR